MHCSIGNSRGVIYNCKIFKYCFAATIMIEAFDQINPLIHLTNLSQVWRENFWREKLLARFFRSAILVTATHATSLWLIHYF